MSKYTDISEKILKEFDYYSPHLPLIDVLLTYIKEQNPSMSLLEASEELTTQNYKKYVSALQKHISEARKNGIIAPYEISSDLKNIVGFSLPRKDDSEFLAKLRSVAHLLPNVLTEIRKLKPEYFEVFCKKILELLDAEGALTTSYSKDGGIDFTGWLKIPETLAHVGQMPKDIEMFRDGFKVLVLGQAKRYKNTLGVSCVRELIGSVSSFHYDQMAPWQSKFTLSGMSLMSPILPVIMTTGKISRDARILSKNCGVLMRDGSELALFIALEGVGIHKNKNGKYRFIKSKFTDWVKA